MARLNVFTLPVPVRRQETREFTEPGLSEPLALTFRDLNPIEELALRDAAQELVETWVARPDGKPAPLVPIPGGDVIAVTRRLCGTIASLMAVQRPEEGEAPYTLVEWLGLMQRMPVALRDVIDWAGSFIGSSGGSSGNSPRGDAPSSPPSPGTPAPIPSSPGDTTPTSEASTPGSDISAAPSEPLPGAPA